MGRSLKHLIAMVEDSNRRGVEFVSLSESIDTSSAGGQLIFHLFAAIAQFEKSLIRQPTIAGIAAARARGKLLGRRPSLSDTQCREIRAALIEGASVRDVARSFNVHPRTVLRGLERLS